MFNANTQKVEGLTGICKDPCPEMSLILGISQEKPMLLHTQSIMTGALQLYYICVMSLDTKLKGSKVYNALTEVDKYVEATKLKQLSKKHKLAKCKQKQQLFKLYEKRQEDISAMNTNPLLLKSASRDKRDNSKNKSGHSYHKKS